jgi:hypothetical protein
MLRYASNLGTYCGVQQAITVERFAVLDFRRPLGGLRLQLDKVDDGHSTQDGSAFALVFSSDTDAGAQHRWFFKIPAPTAQETCCLVSLSVTFSSKVCLGLTGVVGRCIHLARALQTRARNPFRLLPYCLIADTYLAP